MDKLYNIKTYLDKVLLLEASEGDEKSLISTMWYLGMLDMKYATSTDGIKSPMLLFSLRKYHPLSILLKAKIKDTYFLALPYPLAICLDGDKITFHTK